MDAQYEASLTIYYCGREHCIPGHSFGYAVRRHYLLHIILGGKGQFHYDGRIFHLKKGEAFLIIPGAATYYEADKTEPWEYAWVGFAGYEAPGILRKCGLLDGNYTLNAKKYNDLFLYIEMLADEFQQQNRNEFKLKAYLYLVFSYNDAGNPK